VIFVPAAEKERKNPLSKHTHTHEQQQQQNMKMLKQERNKNKNKIYERESYNVRGRKAGRRKAKRIE
jgi:cytoplasmic iron level regulating protein YaaA (DUF328/UPF0246 family)